MRKIKASRSKLRSISDGHKKVKMAGELVAEDLH